MYLQRRSGCAAVVLEGKLVVLGGVAEEYLNVVEQFSPQTMTWDLLPPMSTGMLPCIRLRVVLSVRPTGRGGGGGLAGGV